MRRYNLVNLPEDCRLVTDAFGDWMTVAEHEVLTAKYRDDLEQLAKLGNGDYYGNSDGNMIARNALGKVDK